MIYCNITLNQLHCFSKNINSVNCIAFSSFFLILFLVFIAVDIDIDIDHRMDLFCVMAAMQETQVQSLDWEDPLEKKMVTHSSTLAWKPHGWRSLAD